MYMLLYVSSLNTNVLMMFPCNTTLTLCPSQQMRARSFGKRGVKFSDASESAIFLLKNWPKVKKNSASIFFSFTKDTIFGCVVVVVVEIEEDLEGKEGGKEETEEGGKEVTEGGKEETEEGGKEVTEEGKEVTEEGKEETEEEGKEVTEEGKEETEEGGKEVTEEGKEETEEEGKEVTEEGKEVTEEGKEVTEEGKEDVC